MVEIAQKKGYKAEDIEHIWKIISLFIQVIMFLPVKR